jgi:hypothetical protein
MIRTTCFCPSLDSWDDPNAQHYWAWDAEYVKDLVASVGFTKIEAHERVNTTAYGEAYDYGIWLFGK